MTRARREAGFTLIELAIVLMIVSLLVRIAMPVYAGVRRDAVASQAAGDLHAVHAAAVAQYEATGTYAPDAPPGVVPPALASYLPEKFTFQRANYTLDWDDVTVDDPDSGPSGTVITLTVTTPDHRTGLQVLRTLGANRTHWSVGDSHTFVLLSTLGAGS